MPSPATAPRPRPGVPGGTSPDAGRGAGTVDLTGAPVPAPAAPTPGPAASAPLDLDLPGRNAGPVSSRRQMGLVPLVKPPADTKSKLEKDLEKAQRADCRDAYADKGLLAVIPLAIDAARNKGCKF